MERGRPVGAAARLGLFADQCSDAWLDMLDPDIVAEDRDPLLGSTLVGREAYRAGVDTGHR